MASIGKWSLSATGLTTVLSTELNSLTTNTASSASSAISNDTNLDVYVDIEVNLASLSPSSGAYVTLYILESVDGTNYPGQSGADLRLTPSQALAVIPVGTTAATAQRVVVRQVVIPPAKFKIILDNQTGATLNAAGNTVKFLPYNANLNG